MRSKSPRKPSLVAYLVGATAIVGVVLSVLIARVEPVVEASVLVSHPEARPYGEPFRPRP